MDVLVGAINAANDVIWHNYALFILLGAGVLFTIWSGFGQYRALTHGVAVVRGKYDDSHDPGAISHFEALSTALSATVGLGN
ncbi:MAG: sodium/alanine symporter, partial [Gammaproteobacteria bacterium]